MTTLTFAKTHNLIAYLEKPAESEGFKLILDFLNGSSVRYALTASPTICTSCIKQFWSTAKVKIVNDKVRVEALIDGNRVNIKESSIRRALKLDDEEGISCLANDEIFTALANMVLKPPPGINLAALWHQQSSIFPQTRSLTSPVDHQLGDMSHHQDIYDNPSLSKKVFTNMKMVGTGFSRVITPLFENMLVPAAEEVGQAQDDVSIPAEPSTSKPYKKHKSKKQHLIAPKVPYPEPSQEHQLPSPSTDLIPDADKDRLKLQELMDLCTRLSNKDIDEEEPAEVEEVLEVVIASKLMTEETAASVIVHTEVKPNGKGKGILIEELKPLKCQAQIEQGEAFARQLEAELNANINWNNVIDQVKRSEWQNNKMMRYQALKRKPLTEARARKNMMIHLKKMAGFKMNFFKGMTYSDIRPLFQKHYNSIQYFLEKVEEEVTVQEKEIKEEGNKRQGESLKQKIAKKQRMDEEAEELKRHLQIMANDDDDVYTEATPLASKVSVVDYQIHHENNKPYYKIIRADGTYKLFLSFIILLKNFDREDLKTLWKLVKERFETIEPKNFSDDFLLNILTIMFEKPNVEANVWKDQKGIYGLAKVKN
uniref:Xylulose kinase-1 n=1 Tax=Tanacetum cinerariifolium TaxID=118510 RepID=A0A699J7B3_TANCI|nr:hypothetical protein [Tanacetum cinerariifolium]